MYICTKCHAPYYFMVEHCNACNAWGKVREKNARIILGSDALEIETREGQESAAEEPELDETSVETSRAKKLSEIERPKHPRLSLGLKEFDDYIGDPLHKSPGVVPGTVHLFYGVYGWGKTTLFLQIARDSDMRVLYATGEQAEIELLEVADRLNFNATDRERISVHATEAIEPALETNEKYDLIILDSLQAMDGLPIDTLHEFCLYCRRTGTIGIVISQINKQDDVAGQNAIPHMVASVHYLGIEGQVHFLQPRKNRYGPIEEDGNPRLLGFLMGPNGLTLAPDDFGEEDDEDDFDDDEDEDDDFDDEDAVRRLKRSTKTREPETKRRARAGSGG